MRKLVRLLSKLVAKTNPRPNPALIQPLGLASVAEGFQYVSGEKVRCTSLLYARPLADVAIGQRTEADILDCRYYLRGEKVIHRRCEGVERVLRVTICAVRPRQPRFI